MRNENRWPASDPAPVTVVSTVAVPIPAAAMGTVTVARRLASSLTRLRSASAATTIGPVDVEIDRVVARRPFHVVDLHEEPGLIADREEAGRVPDTTTGSRMTTSAPAWPTRPAVQATAITQGRAVEGRDVEFDLRRAVGCDLDDAGITRERLLGRRRAFDPRRPCRHAERMEPRVPCIPSMR